MTRIARPFLISCLITLGLTAAGSANAHRHGDGPRGLPPSAEQQVARMSEALDLDDTQSAELLAILQRAENEREALRARMDEAFRPEICALRAQTAEEVRAILDEDQIARMEKHRARLAERAMDRPQRRGHRGPAWFECEY